MVINQGDIIKFDFNPILGHEQAGFRPAIVISNETFNKYTDFLIVLPITNSNNEFPLHIQLDERTNTSGYILCEHIKSIDKSARKIKYIENLPKDILERVISMVNAACAVLPSSSRRTKNCLRKLEQHVRFLTIPMHGLIIAESIIFVVSRADQSCLII